MEETKIIITVNCKAPLTEADVRWLQLDVTRRLETTLVQKLASISFKKEANDNT